MSIPGLPLNHVIANALGDSPDAQIEVPAITDDCVILAVIQHNPEDGTILGLDPSDWTAGDGYIESAADDTDGDILTVIFAPQPDNDASDS